MNLRLLIEKKLEKEKDIPTLEEMGVKITWKIVGGKPERRVKASLYNTAKILENYPGFDGSIWWNSFSHKAYFENEELADFHLSEIGIIIDDLWSVTISKQIIFEAYHYVAKKKERNPLRELILEKPWDPENEKSRLDSWLINFFGVEDTKLHRAYSRKFVIGAIGRALYSTLEKPVKFDTSLLIYGGQGLFKSTGIAALSPREEWFGDLAFDMSNPDKAFYATQGKFIYELKEMARRPKDKRVEKGYLDTKIDAVRLPYQSCITRAPRTCVFIGSTNRMDLLNDSSGSRRFWPVCACINPEVSKVRYKELRKVALDIWREANYYYVKGLKEETEFLYWLNPEEEALREESNRLFASVHPWTSRVQQIVETIERPNTRFFYIGEESITIERTNKDIAKITPNLVMECMNFPSRERSPKNRTTIEMIMMELGYFRTRVRDGESRVIIWRKR